MDIIWHLGAHRTGTTTLQHWLGANGQALATHGCAIWGPERTRNGLFTGLIHRPDDLTADQIARGERAAGLIAIELSRLQARGLTSLIVTEENMLGAMRANLARRRLYPDAEARLIRLRAAFGRPIRRVGISIRSYDAYWSSALAFGVAQGWPMPNADLLDRLVTQPRRWRDLVRATARALPETQINVWSFEGTGPAPEAAFRHLTGTVTPNCPEPAQWVNRSPRLAALRRLLVERGDSSAARRLPEGDGRWNPFDHDQRDALRAQYREDIDWLRNGAEGIANYCDETNRKGADLNNAAAGPDMTETEVSGQMARAQAQTYARAAGGQNHGRQGHMA